MDNAVIDFPEPLSPTIAMVSPGKSANETPSTALLRPAGVLKYVLKLLTSRSGGFKLGAPQSWVYGIAQRIAEYVKRQYQDKKRGRRSGKVPPYDRIPG